MTFASIIFSTFLAWDPPPVIPVTPEYEVCVLQAELCAADHAQDMCGFVDVQGLKDCAEDYETCAQFLPDGHNGNCRTFHVWCALEVPLLEKGELDWYVEECSIVNKLCPSY